VTDEIQKQQEEVNRKIDEAYDRLNELENEESGITGELKELNTQRQRYAVLSEISDQLEKLEKLGGAHPPLELSSYITIGIKCQLKGESASGATIVNP
jgi:chromosome segregation ATPase